MSKQIIDYTLQFSFSSKLSRDEYIKGLLHHSFEHIVNFFARKPVGSVKMRDVLKMLTHLIGLKIFKLNRKMEELLAFEAITVMAFMKTEYGPSLPLTMEAFEAKYPQFCAADIILDEKQRLFEFCNCVRVVQCLICPKNNKEHILDLVSRLTEGFSVRRVTGTGMTKETARRYEIIHVEGNLVRQQRPERRVDPSTKPPKIPQKRGRPLSLRV